MTMEIQVKPARIKSKYLALLLALALQALLVTIPSHTYAGQSMASFEEVVINQVYEKSQLDKTNCLFTVRRNSFVESAIEDFPIDLLKVRTLLSTPPKGLYPLVVYLYKSDGEEIHGQVTLYAQRFDSVLTVGSSTKRGQLAEKAEPIFEYRDVTKVIDSPLKRLEQLENMQFRNSARIGSILTREMIEQIPDVEPGDEVIIRYQQGALLLNARGKSLGKGVTGETVRVRNLSSKKIITGTITGVGIVTLQARSAGSR